MNFKLERKKIKNMYLKIKNQEIIVTAPVNMSFTLIQNFVDSKKDWILKQMQKQVHFSNKYEINDKVRMFGSYYNIVENDRFFINENTIFVPENTDIKKYLRVILENYAIRLFEMYCVKMADYFDPPKLKFSYLKGKWGVCFTRKKEIVLSYQLIHTSKRFIEYVMIHELAHLVHPNHSKAFYFFVERYMPDYKQVIKDEQLSF